MAKKEKRPVVVTTKHRGVFFGYAEDTSGDQIKLSNARMCVYWDSSLRGVFGLAAQGPNKNCKISLAPPEVELRDITAVLEMTPESVKNWEAAPWN